jgi:hypothetical protein
MFENYCFNSLKKRKSLQKKKKDLADNIGSTDTCVLKKLTKDDVKALFFASCRQKLRKDKTRILIVLTIILNSRIVLTTSCRRHFFIGHLFLKRGF